jgi:hypothetical protein
LEKKSYYLKSGENMENFKIWRKYGDSNLEKIWRFSNLEKIWRFKSGENMEIFKSGENLEI